MAQGWERPRDRFGAILAITGIGGAMAANAADSTPSPSSSATSAQGGASHTPEEVLTGDTAAKVEAAVKAAYSGATIDRMEKDSDGEGVYEAYITKADGTRVKVMLDESFAITGEKTRGAGHHGKPGRGDHGPTPTASTSSGSGV